MLKKGRKIEFSKWGRVFRIRGRGRCQAEPFLKKWGGGGGDRKTTQNLGVRGQGATFSLQPLFMGLLPTHYYGKHFESL